MSDARRTRPAAPPSRARLIVPVLGGGLLIAIASMLFFGRGERHTVSHVVRTIRKAALAGNEPDAPYGAGLIGPWNVAAERVDPLTGELHHFRLASGRMMIAANRAAVVVDPDADTFGFEMHDVVYTRVPEKGDEDETGFVHHLEYYSLGPAPYGVDIVPDAPTSPRMTPTPLPEGVTPLSRAGLDRE